MKKTYYNSPIPSVFVFFVGSVWEFIYLHLQGTFTVNRLNYLEFLVELGILCLLIWIGMIVEVDPPTMTRRLFFFFTKTHRISEAEGSQIVTASDIYGTDRFVQIRFKDGDKWNLAMFSKKDIREIMESVRRHMKSLPRGEKAFGSK